MKRRDLLLTIPAIGAASSAHQANSTKANPKSRTYKRAPHKQLPPAQDLLDKQLLAMMLLSLYRHDPDGYKYLAQFKGQPTRSAAKLALPELGTILDNIGDVVYKNFHESLQLTGTNTITAAINKFQTQAWNLATVVQNDPKLPAPQPNAYPEHECPSVCNIILAVQAILGIPGPGLC